MFRLLVAIDDLFLHDELHVTSADPITVREEELTVRLAIDRCDEPEACRRAVQVARDTACRPP